MAIKYLITGLPRSRTAWMAAFMDCMHEPTASMDRVEDIARFYTKFDGCADSGMGWWLPWILENVGPRTLIIERPVADVEASLRAVLTDIPHTNYCKRLKVILDECRNKLILRVPYSALSDIAAMRRVFWHLRPGQPFDEGRYQEMNKQRIVVDLNNLYMTGQLLLQPHEGVCLE